MTTIYRNYLIARVGDKFVAQSSDDECLLVASSEQRLNRAIDDLWACLEDGAEPGWFAGSTAIDLDTFGPESVPSSADPPAPRKKEPAWISMWVFGLSAMIVSVPFSLLLQLLHFDRRIDVMFAVGVCATSIAFGRHYALLLSVIALAVYNVCCVNPILTATMPTVSEWIFFACNVFASYSIPAIIKWQESRRVSSSSRRTPNT